MSKKSQLASLEKDIDSRNRIVSDVNTNFFVEAGAGSGKTTMLVSRMTAMVEAGIPIEKICAITFTRAAAGEFYDRFQRLLIERSNPDFVWEDKGGAGQLHKPTEETRKRCAEALQNIDLCFMGTIDSFCAKVLSEHPSEAGIPSNAAVVLDQEAEILYKQQYVKICSGEYGEGLAKLARRFRMVHNHDENVFVQGEAVFMNHRNVHFHYTKREAVDVDKVFASERNALVRALKFLLEHPELKYEKENHNLIAWTQLKIAFNILCRRWDRNFPKVLSVLEKSFKNLRLVPEAADRYGEILSGLFELGGKTGKWLECTIGRSGRLLEQLRNFQYSISMEFLERCVPVLESAMRDKGAMTFFDYLYYLRNMLRRDAEGNGNLIRYIYDRHSYFLIDEFQDTNPMQAEIFFYLSSEHPVAQWSACVPRPGALFIVGDPKQSIYRFRSADVTSFLKVKGLFEKNGDTILSLSRNFRSTKTLCEHFNTVFSKMLPEETINQSKFEVIPLPEEKRDEFQGVFTYTEYSGTGVSAENGEPGQIAKIIDTLVDDAAFLIRAGDDKTPRKIRYGDIMIITYGKKDLKPIMAYLDTQGIPTRVEGDVLFGENEALSEVFKIYSAVADAEDAVSLYGSLTGSLFGVTKEALLRYKANVGAISLTSSFDVGNCEDETVLLIASRVEKLKELHRKAQRLSPAALFAEIMDRFRVYETADAENLEIMYYTLELMRSAEKSGLLVTLKDGADYIQKLVDGISGEERCLRLNDGKDAVHLANLHKVKGLEAPVVILAGEKAGSAFYDQRIVHGDNGSEGYIFRLSQRYAENKRYNFFSTKEFPDEQTLEEEAGGAEMQRLAYVAATRARNVLVIHESGQLWCPIMPIDPSILNDSEEPLDFFKRFSPADGKNKVESETVDAATLYEEAEKSCVLNNREMESATYSVENPSRLQLLSKISDADAQDIGTAAVASDRFDTEESAEQKAGGVYRFPALLGTMTHKLMEMLVSTKDEIDTDEAVGEIIREYRTPEMEPYEKELTKALTNVAKKMRSGGFAQTNGIPQDLLNTLLHADEVYCEVPFCYSEDGKDGRKLWNGVMDVVYCLKGKWHIVDYKTNAAGNNLDQKYQAQLDAYVKAFKATTGNDADALTYHIAV